MKERWRGRDRYVGVGNPLAGLRSELEGSIKIIIVKL